MSRYGTHVRQYVYSNQKNEQKKFQNIKKEIDQHVDIATSTTSPSIEVREMKPKMYCKELNIENTPYIDGLRGSVIDNKLYTFGGGYRNEQRSYVRYDSLHELDPVGKVLKEAKVADSSSKPPGVTAHDCVVRERMVDGKIKKTLLVIGGSTSRDHRTNSTWEFDFESQKWTNIICDHPPELMAIAAHTAQYHAGADHVYVFGGIINNEKEYSKNLYRLDIPQKKWAEVQVSGSKPSPRIFASSVMFRDNFLFIFGGKTITENKDTDRNDVWCFNITTEQWHQINCTGETPIPRHFAACRLHQDYMYIYSGCKKNDLHRLNLLTYQWEEIKLVGVSIPNTLGSFLAHVKVPTPPYQPHPFSNQFILFGGANIKIYQSNKIYSIAFDDKDESFQYLLTQDAFLDMVVVFSPKHTLQHNKLV